MADTRTQAPYAVTHQQHERTYRPDGTEGGQFTVHLEHNNGVKSSLVIPEEHYTPEHVHQRAMEHVNAVAMVAHLPHSLAGHEQAVA